MDKPALYASMTALQRQKMAEVFKEYMENLHWVEEESVLDIGCGSGEVTTLILLPHLPNTFKRLVAMDINEKMLNYASSTHHHPKLKFMQADIATEDLRSSELWQEAGEGFHKIFSCLCLHWVQNQRLAMKNIHALLRKNGEAVLLLVAYSKLYSMYEVISKMPKWKEYTQDAYKYISPYQHSEDPVQEFTVLLQDIGFSDVHCQIQERIYGHSKELVEALSPFLSNVPLHLQADFIKDCFETLCELDLPPGVEHTGCDIGSNEALGYHTILSAYIRK